MTSPPTPHDDGALRRQLDQLRVLYALTETLMASTDVAQMYDAAMDGFRGALAVERVSFLLSEADGVPRFRAWRGLSDTYRRAVEGHNFWAPDDPNPTPVVVADVATDPSMAAFRDVALAEGIASLVAVPLVVRGRTIGKCMLYFDRPRVLSPDELRLAHTVADHVAFAVERKRAGDDLEASSALLRAIVDGTPGIVLVKDRAGRYLLANRAAMEFSGPRSPLLGERASDVLDPDNARIVPEFDRLVIEEGRTVRHDLLMADSHGTARAFHATRGPILGAQGDVAGIFVILHDVTEREAAERQVRENEERFRSLLQNASDITSVLGPDGTIKYESPAFYRLLGWNEAEILGRNAFEFVHPDDRDLVMDVFAEALRTERESRPVEFRFRRADGSYLTLEAKGVNRLADPLIAGVIVNSRDVTERNRLAEELRQAQKMEAIGRLAGGIAHDFNNLLTVIGGYSEAALFEQDPAEVRHCLEEVRRASDRASKLTTQLLAFARRRVITPSAVDLNAAIAGLVDMLQRLIGTDVRLETALGPHVGAIRVDRGQLEQVVMNLAINARDAMPQGGTLTLSTAADDAGDAVLTVQDTGRGMDRETVAHMFEPFFTTKGPGQGTGLGLATVYGIVTQHGGTIAVDSAPGRGTSFRITFPREPGDAASLRPPADLRTDTAGSETILLVEDEPMVRGLVRTMLRSRGYTVLEASSGEEAMERFAGRLDDIQLLLTDVVMPGINGRVLAETLTTRRPSLKVLFMSGYTEDAVLGAQRRDVQFLQKPFAPDVLRAKVREVLDTPPAVPAA